MFFISYILFSWYNNPHHLHCVVWTYVWVFAHRLLYSDQQVSKDIQWEFFTNCVFLVPVYPNNCKWAVLRHLLEKCCTFFTLFVQLLRQSQVFFYIFNCLLQIETSVTLFIHILWIDSHS